MVRLLQPISHHPPTSLSDSPLLPPSHLSHLSRPPLHHLSLYMMASLSPHCHLSPTSIPSPPTSLSHPPQLSLSHLLNISLPLSHFSHLSLTSLPPLSTSFISLPPLSQLSPTSLLAKFIKHFNVIFNFLLLVMCIIVL